MLRFLTTASAFSALAAVTIAIPTDLINTPVFSREVPPTWWAWPALVSYAVLSGLLAASWLASRGGVGATKLADAGQRRGLAAGLLTFLAVGCPVCNKIVLMALGSAGALSWFAPVQPLLQLAAIALLAWALVRRVQAARSCPITPIAINTIQGS